MECINCHLNDICIVADMAKKYSLDMDITITNCKKKNNLIETKDIPTESNLVIPPPRQYKDLKVIAKDLIKEDPESMTINVNVVDEDNEDTKSLEKIQCPNCGATTTIDDIEMCSTEGCSEMTCSNCGTESEGKRYCSKCW